MHITLPYKLSHNREKSQLLAVERLQNLMQTLLFSGRFKEHLMKQSVSKNTVI